jgi:inorganic pyrophosphatase
LTITNYLATLPVSTIAPFCGTPPKDAVTFVGHPRRQPNDSSKLLLVQDVPGNQPVVTEFNLEDVRSIETMPSPVTDSGETVQLVKVWVRRGAVGVVLEPFEVNDPPRFLRAAQDAATRLKSAQTEA